MNKVERRTGREEERGRAKNKPDKNEETAKRKICTKDMHNRASVLCSTEKQKTEEEEKKRGECG